MKYDWRAIHQGMGRHIEFSSGEVPSRKMFCENIENKLTMPEFLSDTEAYLRTGVCFNPLEAWPVIKDRFLSR